MTATLSCRDVERLMLGSEDRDLPPGERALVEEHLQGCGRCRAFASDRAAIRRAAAAVAWPALPGELDRRTRTELRERAREAEKPVVPTWVLVALAVVTITTGIWVAVSLADVAPDTTLADLPFAGLAAVFIIIQNALTLLFAPVVLRTFRARGGASRSA
jgi:predicted anti-sigma-YlaC factor YlaD